MRRAPLQGLGARVGMCECSICGCADMWMCGLSLETGVSLGIYWQIYWRAQGSPTGAGGAGGNVES